MKIKILLFLIFLCNLSFAQSVKLKIIETTDVHGAMFPYDFKNDEYENGSLAQVYSYVKRERSNTGQEVILLDNGDILQGTPLVYYYNYELPDSQHVFANVMNFMGYDAATIGNHDIETGHSVYDKFNDEIDFVWLAANAVCADSNEPYFSPYAVIEKADVKIAVLGLITPGIPSWLPPQIYSGIEFNDMIETADDWVSQIIEIENPDVIVGLFHSGVDFTYSNQTDTTYKNENAALLVAQKVPGFDVVFVGHDHHGWDTTIVNRVGKSVRVMGGTSGARNVAAAEITLTKDYESDRWEKNISGSLVDMDAYEADTEFLKRYSNVFLRVKNYVARPIGEIESTISSNDALFGPSQFVDLINFIQLDITKADISFAALLSLNASIEKGKVFVRDMFELYKYENLLYTIKLSGAEIKDYLEYSCGLWFNTMQDSSGHLLNFEIDEDSNLVYSQRTNTPSLKNSFYNFDAAAGIEYVVDVTKPVGERVTIMQMSKGGDFYADSIYTVAVNSYRGNGGGGHLIYGAKIKPEQLQSRIINSTDKDLRYYMMKWFEETKTVSPFSFGNWSVVPVEWWEKAKETDYKLMFGNKVEE
ncbi:MAG: bifunctional UDP-sugar hydrolase/5'-nucleotidase [bacterium]